MARKRSSGYPGLSLEPVLGLLEEVQKKLGQGPYSREAVAESLGHKGVTGASATKVAAFAHFGLFDKLSGAYEMSDLSKRILFEKTEDDKDAAIAEAALTPKLYRAIYDDYKDKALPDMLSNLLIHNYNIREGAAKSVAADIKASFDYAKLLTNGVLRSPVPGGQHNQEVDHNGSDLSDKNNDSERLSVPADSNAPSPVDGTFDVPLADGVLMRFSNKYALPVALGSFSEGIEKIQAIIKKISENGDVPE